MSTSTSNVRSRDIKTTIVNFDTPKQITITHNIVKYRYFTYELKLNEYVEFCIMFYTEQGRIATTYLKVSGEQYNQWGDDDDYIKNLIENNIDYLYSNQIGKIPTVFDAL